MTYYIGSLSLAKFCQGLLGTKCRAHNHLSSIISRPIYMYLSINLRYESHTVKQAVIMLEQGSVLLMHFTWSILADS